MNISRRHFLKALGLASAMLLVDGKSAVSQALAEAGDLNMLVIGDSFIWGQGLEEKDKIYTLTANWLASEAFQNKRKVDVKVKAHSGATIKFRKEESLAYQRAERQETFYYDPEINVGFPSMWKQIEVAADEYRAVGKPKGLNPFSDQKKLPGLIEKFCRDDMFELMEHAALNNPNAIIAIVGYFPIISNVSVGSRVFNGWLESMAFPRPLKPVANNVMTRTLIFNKIKRKVIRLSNIWVRESDRKLAGGVYSDANHNRHLFRNTKYTAVPAREKRSFRRLSL